MDDDLINNLSTIAVILYGVFSPFLAQYLSSEQFSALFIAVFGVVLIVVSAFNPNTMKVFGNGKSCNCKGSTEETVLNDEYEVEVDDSN